MPLLPATLQAVDASIQKPMLVYQALQVTVSTTWKHEKKKNKNKAALTVSFFNCNITVHIRLPATDISEQSGGNLPDKRQNLRSPNIATDELNI